jgi:hypothetical protein
MCQICFLQQRPQQIKEGQSGGDQDPGNEVIPHPHVGFWVHFFHSSIAAFLFTPANFFFTHIDFSCNDFTGM